MKEQPKIISMECISMMATSNKDGSPIRVPAGYVYVIQFGRIEVKFESNSPFKHAGEIIEEARSLLLSDV